MHLPPPEVCLLLCNKPSGMAALFAKRERRNPVSGSAMLSPPPGSCTLLCNEPLGMMALFAKHAGQILGRAGCSSPLPMMSVHPPG